MLNKIKEFDRFYYILAAVLTIGALVTILILRGVFSAVSTANSLAEDATNTDIQHINKSDIDRLHGVLYEKDIPRLDL